MAATKRVYILDGDYPGAKYEQVSGDIEIAAELRGPAVAFLASEKVSWITGRLLVAHGGHTNEELA